MKKIEPVDYQFVPVDPDSDFSEEKNRNVIEESIKRTDLLFKRRQRELAQQTRERVSAVARYVKALDTGQTESGVLEYFGRKEMARLRGEQIRNTLMARLQNAKKERTSQTEKLASSQLG